MSVKEVEAAVTKLSREELAKFHEWYEVYFADQWDQQIEEDVRAGRLDHLVAEADAEFEAGRCQPL